MQVAEKKDTPNLVVYQAISPFFWNVFYWILYCKTKPVIKSVFPNLPDSMGPHFRSHISLVSNEVEHLSPLQEARHAEMAPQSGGGHLEDQGRVGEHLLFYWQRLETANFSLIFPLSNLAKWGSKRYARSTTCFFVAKVWETMTVKLAYQVNHEARPQMSHCI